MFKLFNRIPKSSFRSGFQPRLTYQPVSIRFISTEIKDAIQKAVDSSKIVLFMKGTPEFPQCGFSRASIQILGQQGVDPEKFAAYNVLEDQELREGIKEFSNWPTIPQLYVDGEFIGGCDIIMSMAKSGELAELLENSDCLVPEEPELESNVQPQERN
ncbi:monothiol glutaredoxin-5, mitochondrial [[Candida] jaroonii]|uniref:Monothiol glutaredoxin-5, mitochondrial n=1 Tax=[Candida] jaroonii TaxID=467808 RepID=A0ACA9Y659_9ASCO|nr:monothiol glutaredoxin-5, mitochondrial [[Candida] jaroonii]